MHLKSRPFLRFLSDPLSRQAKRMEVTRDGFAVTGGPLAVVPFDKVTKPPTMRGHLLGTSVEIHSQSVPDIRLPAVRKTAAFTFVKTAETAWREFNLAKLNDEKNRIDQLLSDLAELSQPTQYPAALYVEPIAVSAVDLETGLLCKLNADAIGAETRAKISPIRQFASDPIGKRSEAIDRFVEAELERWKEFFDTVESMPLTKEQRLSVVVDEDATLVLAGAGSGKTSVITAKAAYLIKSGIRTPGEILLLAFARDAAKEMSERIEARCGEPVEARTFHALAYDIIGDVEGSKPALAAHASDDKAYLDLIREILRHLVATASEIASLIIGWFSHFFDEPRDAWDFNTKHDWYTEIERLDLRTLQGERVASFEELQIANWLYQNGIAYEYEPIYEHKLPKSGRREYTPDFRLTDSGVYIEHFGVRKKTRPDGTEELTTAPFIDRDAYVADMQWKIETHQEHGTELISTYSWEQSEGRLLEALAEKIAPHVEINPRPPLEIYDRVTEMGAVDSFTSLLGTFLKHFKSGNYSVERCLEKAEKLKLTKPAGAFLRIFEAVFEEYQKRLDGRIDFEDMVSRATEHVESGRYSSPFKHILVDEFQDISEGRARLIKALKARHQDARMFAVGDDWQSIYRFAGSDIHIMRHFGETFGGTYNGETGIHRTVDLGRTFRSVDKIALPARKFVLRNPAQLKKTVVPAGQADTPAIHVVWTRKADEKERLNETLALLEDTAPAEDRAPSVLLLGRYRRLRPDMPKLSRQFPKLNLTYKTIHAAKGLEADHVILLGANRATNGFPSEIVDDPLLSLVSPEAEPFEHAEERRVMYVAMTRARKSFTMLAAESRPSVFVTELLESEGAVLDALGDECLTQTHICGECEGRLIQAKSQADRVWYMCEHHKLCGNRLPACTACGIGLPRRETSPDTKSCSHCGETTTACPACDDGWLVERKGRYGAFLGCVRYPDCSGKEKKPKVRKKRHRSGK